MLKVSKRYILAVMITLFIMLDQRPIATAWDNKTTHIDISDVAAQRSVLGIGGYLQRSLGIKGGLNTKLQWSGGGADKIINLWVQQGANFEDDGGIINGRFYNHFHNPLEP